MMRRILRGVGAAAAILVIGGTGASAGTVYGVDDSGRILGVDLVTKSQSVLLTPGVGANANGMAYDAVGGRLLFRNPATAANTLTAFDLTTHAVSTINVPGLTGDSSSAAFYNGSYWFVRQGTDDLVKVDLSGGTPVVSTMFNFDGNAFSTFSFGDIAITKDGLLYGSSNRGLFSLDISGSTPTGFDLINASTPQLQIALQPDGTLIGQQHDGATAGQWYKINLDTGVASKIDGFKTTALRDIAGTAVPEPSSIAMLGLGGLSILGVAHRRKRLAA